MKCVLEDSLSTVESKIVDAEEELLLIYYRNHTGGIE